MSLGELFPRRRSYRATPDVGHQGHDQEDEVEGPDLDQGPPWIERSIESRTSSKMVTERKTTMAKAPGVSNLAWPYGWSSSGPCAAGARPRGRDVVDAVDGGVDRVAQDGEGARGRAR